MRRTWSENLPENIKWVFRKVVPPHVRAHCDDEEDAERHRLYGIDRLLRPSPVRNETYFNIWLAIDGVFENQDGKRRLQPEQTSVSYWWSWQIHYQQVRQVWKDAWQRWKHRFWGPKKKGGNRVRFETLRAKWGAPSRVRAISEAKRREA